MKNYAKLSAAAFAGVMALSSMGINVFADEADTVPVIKTVTKNDSSALVPRVSFEYKAEPAAQDGSIYAGVKGGLVFVNSESTLKANDDKIGNATTTYTGASLNAPVSAYTHPGVYHYAVTETTSYDDNYDGLSTTKTSIDVYVHVTNGTDGLEVAAITASKEGNAKSAVDFAADYTTYTLAVTKEVTGNQGDTNRDFNFTGTVSTSGTEDRFTEAKGNNIASLVGDKNSLSTTLKNGETYTIHGLSAKDVASIAEDDYSSEGYTTTIKKGDTAATSVEKTAADNTDLAYTVTNHKQVDTPTGILLTAAPYAALVALGGIFAGLFFRRKKED